MPYSNLETGPYRSCLLLSGFWIRLDHDSLQKIIKICPDAEFGVKCSQIINKDSSFEQKIAKFLTKDEVESYTFQTTSIYFQ
jgi:hypothetical protein